MNTNMARTKMGRTESVFLQCTEHFPYYPLDVLYIHSTSICSTNTRTAPNRIITKWKDKKKKAAEEIGSNVKKSKNTV